jgi:WD40 repeat protein
VLWDTEAVTLKKEEVTEVKKKKKKIEISDLPMKSEITGVHTMQVTDMQFVGPSQLLTASLDHTIKLVDINKGAAVSTIHTSYASVCSIDSTQNVVFSGLTDSTIRQWDLRECSQVKVYSETHTSWVSSISINPLNRNILASGGYDGLVAVWDIRGSKKPLQKICTQKDKVMAVGWNGPQKIVSGGCEGQLYVHSLTFDHKE